MKTLLGTAALAALVLAAAPALAQRGHGGGGLSWRWRFPRWRRFPRRWWLPWRRWFPWRLRLARLGMRGLFRLRRALLSLLLRRRPTITAIPIPYPAYSYDEYYDDTPDYGPPPPPPEREAERAAAAQQLACHPPAGRDRLRACPTACCSRWIRPRSRRMPTMCCRKSPTRRMTGPMHAWWWKAIPTPPAAANTMWNCRSARADAVAAVLARKGVERERIKTEGLGETHLAVQTGDGVREPRNRRVIIRLIGGNMPRGRSATTTTSADSIEPWPGRSRERADLVCLGLRNRRPRSGLTRLTNWKWGRRPHWRA